MEHLKASLINIFALVALFITGCSGMLDVPNSAADPGLKISSSTGGYSVFEDSGTLDIYITLARRPSDDVTIPVTISDPSKATINITTLTFTNSNWEVPQKITVTGVGNYIADGNKNVSLWFGIATSNDPAYNGYVEPSIPIIIIDNETPSIVVSPTEGLVTSETGGTATFTVVLSSEPTGNVMISSITSSDTTEGTVDKSSLTFTPSNWNNPQVITITGEDDIINDNNISYTIVFSNSSSSDPNYNNVSLPPITVINNDNEIPAATVTPLTLNITEGSTATFTVKLNNVPTGTVTIPVYSNTIRANVDKSIITFTPDNYDTPQVVTVSAIQNASHDGNAIGKIILGNASGYDDYDPDDVTVTISDDDAFEIRFGSLSRHTNEGGQDATFTVKLGSKPTNDVIIHLDEKYQAVNNANQEGTISTNSLAFTPDEWDQPKTVIVYGVNDDYADGNQVYLIHAVATSSDPDYNGITNDFAVTNDDDDSYGLQIVANGVTTNVTNSDVTLTGFATDDMGNLGSNYANWTIKLRSKPYYNVVITLSSNSTNNDGIIKVDGTTTTTMTFTPDNWSIPQTVTVTGASDGTNEGGHVYTISTSISSSDPKYGSTTYVKHPKFAIFSSDNDVSNTIAYCRKSGGFATSENNGTATFWLITQSLPSSDETVTVTSTDKFSYLDQVIATVITPADGNIIIKSSNYNFLDPSGTNKVLIQGNDDGNEPRGGQYFNVQFSTSTPNLGFTVPELTILNQDNDQVIAIGNISGNTSEDGTQATFGVKLKIAPSAGQTVTFTVSPKNPTEGTFTPVTLTFTDSNWDTYQNITVTGVDDHRVDGPQVIKMSYSDISSTDERLDGYPGGSLDTGVMNDDNDKLIWITDTEYFGNMGSGVTQADIAANTTTDSNYPTSMPEGTVYKALIVDGTNRIARTTPTGNTGQKDWVLKPNTEYYLKTGSFPYTTKIFTTDQYGIPQSFNQPFSSNSSDSFWTGLNPDWTTSADTCGEWKVDNINGTYGIGGTTGIGAISYGTALSNGSKKRIIAVQQ